MERGVVNGQLAGILWFSEDEPRPRTIFSKRAEKLQKDWWGFPKLKKADLSAIRCRKCCLVLFKYDGTNC
jgi:hypothetical protein